MNRKHVVLTVVMAMMLALALTAGAVETPKPPSSGGGGGGCFGPPYMNVVVDGSDHSAIAGQGDIKLVFVYLTNETGKARVLRHLRLLVFAEGDMVAQLSNLRLYCNGTLLETVNDPDEHVSQGTDRSWAWVKFNILPEQQPEIQPGKTVELKVTFNISTATADGTVISSAIQPRWIKFDRHVRTCPRPRTTLYGPEITVRRAGGLTIERSWDSPRSELLHSEAMIIRVLQAKVRATAIEGVKILAIPIYIGKINGGGPDQIRQIYVFANGELIAMVVPATTDDWPENPAPLTPGGAWVDLSNNPLVIPANTEVTFDFWIDASACNNRLGTLGKSGQGFTLEIPGEQIKAKGMSSGCEITPSGEANSSEGYLFSSVPTVVQAEGFMDMWGSSLNPGMEWQKNLYHLGVYASWTDSDVGLNRFSFEIDSSDNVTYDNFEVWTSGGVFVGNGEVDSDGVLVITFDEVFRLPAWSFEDFYLTADVLTVLSNPTDPTEEAWLSVTMLGDEGLPEPLPATLEEIHSQAYFEWTDFTWSGPSEPGEQPEWSNSALVQTINGGVLPVRSTPIVFVWPH